MSQELPLIRWSMFNHYEPIRIIIKDWSSIKRFYTFMKVDSQMEYKGRMIQLCVPYHLFINKILKLPTEQQRMIREGNAVIELMKTYKKDDYGMKILRVEKHDESDDKQP